MKYENINKSTIDFINNILLTHKILSPQVYLKMKHTGDLAIQLAENFNLLDDDFYIASYLSNIGLLSLMNILEKDNFIHDKEYAQIKRHPILSAEVVKQLGFEKASLLIYYHHENPKYLGYFKTDNYPIEANFINIADTFHGCVCQKGFRPPLTFNEAIEETLKHYKDTSFENTYSINEISNILKKYHSNFF